MTQVPAMTYRFKDVESLTRSIDLADKLGHLGQGFVVALAPDTARSLVTVLKIGQAVQGGADALEARRASLDAHAEWLIAKSDELARQQVRHMNELLLLLGAWGVSLIVTMAMEPLFHIIWG